MKLIITILLSFLSFHCLADGNLSFVAGQYYFEFNNGQIINRSPIKYELFSQTYIPNTTIWKLNFKSVLRVKVPANNESYQSINIISRTHAEIHFNPDKTLISASFGEHVFILSIDYHIIKAYSNTNFKGWKNNEEIIVEVEDKSGGSAYGTSNYLLNIVQEDRKKRK